MKFLANILGCSSADDVDPESKDPGISNRRNMRMMTTCIREIQAPVADLCGLQSIMADIPEESSLYY